MCYIPSYMLVQTAKRSPRNWYSSILD